MRVGYYPKLAVDGIRKNRKFYLPFLMISACMVMMYYIICFLVAEPVMEGIPGSESMQSMLDLGSIVIAAFSVALLFYTHAFLIRRRKKEFGLYNILGMGKGNIGKILFWETLLAALMALVGGLGVGIALSKLAELALVNIMHGTAGYVFQISVPAVLKCCLLFGVIFLLLMISSLLQVRIASPVALLRSENVGEKQPKANWFWGICGVLLLASAYYLAVSIKEPMTALVVFFGAVLMVIAATYLLFIAGSVLLCRLLQKNKRYYYKANHFVSVSSMAYRMKRNGASLASICILSTMVLVMISSSTCLYFGVENSLNNQYPRDLMVNLQMQGASDLEDENVAQLRTAVEEVLQAEGALPEGASGSSAGSDVMEYRFAVIAGSLQNGVLSLDASALAQFQLSSYDTVRQVYFVPLADYNRMTGAEEILSADEVLIYSNRGRYTEDGFAIQDGPSFQVKKVLNDFPFTGIADVNVVTSVFVVVSDLESSTAELERLADYNGDRMLILQWLYGVDVSADYETETALAEKLDQVVDQIETGGERGVIHSEVTSLAAEKADFYGVYGGIFFLGILLSIVFILATVLLIYYKQISEGYEDQGRFEIMQKVGMTKAEIQRSINSQMLTVFMLPLLMAVLHLGFAFPMIRKLLLLFNATNLSLLLVTTGVSILVFAVFYVIVYRITASGYYGIVSGRK